MKKAIPYFIALIFLSILSVYYVWSFNPSLSEIFVPLLKGRVAAPDYTIFSFSHISDIINEHSLLSAIGIVLLLSFVLAFRNRISFKNPIVLFLAIASVAQMSYQFMVDPKLGGGRDWDLFSSVALGYTLLAIYFFLSLRLTSKYSKVVLMFTAVLTIFPWFMLNANTQSSIARFKDLLDIDLKKSTNGRYTLVRYYSQHSDSTAAAVEKKEIFRLFPEDSLLRIAHTYVGRGSYDTAIALLQKVIDLNPALGPAYNELGRIYFGRGEIDKAFNVFKDLSRAEPFSPGVHHNLAKTLLAQGNLEEGLKELNKAVRFGAKDASVYTDLGNVYFQLGDTKKALKAYNTAIKLDPTFWVARLNLGQMYLRLKLPNEAQVQFEEAFKLKPDEPSIYYYLGVSYAYQGMTNKAIKSFELFLQRSPETPQKEQVRTWLKQLQTQKN